MATINKNTQMRHSVAYLLSTAVEFLVPLISLPIFMAVLSPHDYGAMALAQVYAVFMVGLANLGMTISYDRNFFQYQNSPADGARLFYSCLLFVMTNMILVGLLTYIFRDPLSVVMQIRGMGDLLVFVFAAEVTNSLLQFYMIHLRNSEKAREYMINDVAGNLISVGLSLAFVFMFKTGVVGFVIGKLLANTAMLGFMQLRLSHSLPFAVDKKIFVSALKFSLPLTPRLFLGVLSTQFDKFLLGLLSNLDGVGIYNIAQKISYGIFAFMVSIQNVFIPRAYKMMFNDGEQAGRNVGAYLTPYAYLCTGVAMAVGFFSEEFIQLFTPHQYHGIVGIILVLSIFYAIQFIGRITAMQLLYSKKTILISVLSVITLLANVAINIPFILHWGAIGAAWGALTVGVVSVGISFYLGQKAFNIVWERKKVWAIFGSFALTSIILLIMKSCDVAYAARLATKLIFAAMYVFLGFRCGWIRRDQWNSLMQIGRQQDAAPAV